MDNSNDKSNEHIKEMLDIVKEENPPDTEKTQPGKVLSQKEKLMKLMMMIKVSTMIKIIKEDNTPIELIDGLFIGSFASSLNKKALLENGITHIVVCGTGLKQNYPNEFKYVQFNLLDSENEDIKKYFIEVGIFIDSAFKNGGKVLVHWYDYYLFQLTHLVMLGFQEAQLLF